jgi:hypothetical protein
VSEWAGTDRRWGTGHGRRTHPSRGDADGPTRNWRAAAPCEWASFVLDLPAPSSIRPLPPSIAKSNHRKFLTGRCCPSSSHSHDLGGSTPRLSVAGVQAPGGLKLHESVARPLAGASVVTNDGRTLKTDNTADNTAASTTTRRATQRNAPQQRLRTVRPLATTARGLVLHPRPR